MKNDIEIINNLNRSVSNPALKISDDTSELLTKLQSKDDALKKRLSDLTGKIKEKDKVIDTTLANTIYYLHIEIYGPYGHL